MNGFKALKCKVMSVFISLEAVVFLIRDSDWGGGEGGKWRGNQKSITPENSASRFKPSSQGSSQKDSALPGATEQV